VVRRLEDEEFCLGRLGRAAGTSCTGLGILEGKSVCEGVGDGTAPGDGTVGEERAVTMERDSARRRGGGGSGDGAVRRSVCRVLSSPAQKEKGRRIIERLESVVFRTGRDWLLLAGVGLLERLEIGVMEFERSVRERDNCFDEAASAESDRISAGARELLEDMDAANSSLCGSKTMPAR